MDALIAEFGTKVGQTFTLLFIAYSSLLLTWPFFLWLEKRYPVIANTPRSNFWLNWRITASNLFLAPTFAVLVSLGTIYVANQLGTPGLEVPTMQFSVGLPIVDILLQAFVIFLVACFLGDFSYYWWHRLQHTVPFFWELHKLHHSDENLNTTTIYRSHFLEPAGQGLIRGLTVGLIFDTNVAPTATIVALLIGGLGPVVWDYFIHANVKIDALHRLLPFFSTPQYHWIHHSKEIQHQDKNYAIWLPMFDIAFGTYYHPDVEEYPPTGLSSGEKFETLWKGQTAPFVGWAGMLKRRLQRNDEVESN